MNFRWLDGRSFSTGAGAFPTMRAIDIADVVTPPTA
jgi:hypothetical protein